MIIIKAITGETSRELEVKSGVLLLNALRDNGLDVIAPCGGNGTCGKCRVLVKGQGSVTSCLFLVKEDIEVVLPDRKESTILEKQHEFTRAVSLQPGEEAEKAPFPLGIAVDIGTTTIVCYLVNLITGSVLETVSGMNPQVRYGADVISRIQHAGKGPSQLKQLQDILLSFLNEKIEFMAHNSGFDVSFIVKMSVAANNTMLHLLKGVDPSSMAHVPFTPRFTSSQKIRFSELKIHGNEMGMITLLPSLSAYVGADIMAGIASIHPGEGIRNYLFLDIGTNGELALVTPRKIWCCATAAGPAFEGANISCGMGALSGAIKSFTNKGYMVIENEPAAGICGSGLIDLIAVLLEKGIITSEGIISGDYLIANTDVTADSEPLYLTQQDVREVQLAKSAIKSGINILLQEAGMDFKDLDGLFLAGGFGNYINIDNAMRIGLLPLEMKGKIIPIGNTSGTGAILALKSVVFEKSLEDVISKSILVELSDNENFEMEFAMNMYFI